MSGFRCVAVTWIVLDRGLDLYLAIREDCVEVAY